jgi:hypothetical protein
MAGFDRGLRHVHHSQRRQGESGAVAGGEGGDRPHQRPSPADEQHLGQHEEEVIPAEQDVLDSQHGVVVLEDSSTAAVGVDREAGRFGLEQVPDPAAVAQGDARPPAPLTKIRLEMRPSLHLCSHIRRIP